MASRCIRADTGLQQKSLLAREADCGAKFPVPATISDNTNMVAAPSDTQENANKGSVVAQGVNPVTLLLWNMLMARVLFSSDGPPA